MAEGIKEQDIDLESILLRVDDTPLADEDLFDVKSELISVVASWKDIGTGLRLGTGKLDAIGTQYPSNPKACLSEVLTKWLKKDYNVKKFGEPTWQWIVKVVAHPAAGSDPALALSIAKKHTTDRPEEEMLPNVAQVKKNEATDTKSSGILSHSVSKVKTCLIALQNIKCSSDTEEKSLINLIQAELRNFIKTCVQSGIRSEQLKEELSGLYSSELLISEDMYKWALQLASDEYSTISIIASSSEQESEPRSKVQPLFSKETLYHAGLCCCATSTCDAATYKDFFKREGHSLEEASISRMPEIDQKKIDRYLIARQGKTYYVAFQSKPHLSQWANEHLSFKEGISSQCEKIPLRFFIEQLRDGYRIVLAGFSFGGLLALAVAASMWKLTLLSADLLKDNLVCITFGLPLISIPLVEETAQECPEFVTTVHSIFLKDDPVPQLMQFLDPICEEQYTQMLQRLEHSEPAKAFLKLAACSTSTKFQGPFTSMLLQHLSVLQEWGLQEPAMAILPPDSDDTAQNALRNVQMLLKNILPYLTRKQFPTFGKSYVVSVELHTEPWREVVHSEVQLELGWPIQPEHMDVIIFQKHKMEIYNRRTFRSYIEQSPSKYNIPPLSEETISEMKILKPSVQAVAFHRHANELATVVEGENLWFCHQIAVGPHKTNTPAQKISRKAIIFNFTLSDKHNIPTDDDRVKATLSSHFYHPQSKVVPVAHKAYRFTFRQEQLAKLTPSELIEVAYLSTLLEQHSHSHLQCYSDRFRAFREFLQQVVVVVPIESILFTISETSSNDVALQCVSAMVASKLEVQPSLAAADSGFAAVDRILHMHGYINDERHNKYVGATGAGIGEYSESGTNKSGLSEKKIRKEIKKSVQCTQHSIVSQQPTLLQQSIRRSSWRLSRYLKPYSFVDLRFQMILLTTDCPSNLRYVLTAMQRMQEAFRKLPQVDAVCGVGLDCIYPITSYDDPSSSDILELKSPIRILSGGRKKLGWLAKQAITTDVSSEPSETSQQKSQLSFLYNSKMLEIVNHIRQKDVKTCTSLLGAFMEHQIRVPLIKSPLDTAKALNVMLTTAAVGVWALFSLTLGDLHSVLQSIPGRSLMVEVTKYIRGIFKQETLTADEKYAGKLQFMVQGMKKTVSCNSHYISYSLERQLVELCRKLNIDESTSLETLTNNWDTIFKDDVLALVVPTHRSLIARWLKWALMIHHLREELAKYTAVGVVGLVNSGKSLLVNNLFNIQVPIGTTEVKRTTVPFLYNLDDDIEGLDVIDFPGVDDRDETISDLADLLLTLAQIVVFVVDYRKVHTESAKKWLERLEEESVPVLVCLTFADKLYAEWMSKDSAGMHVHPPPQTIKRKISTELSRVEEKLGQNPSHTVGYFSFCQDRDSVLNTPEGRQQLKDAGISCPQDVGDWLVDVFKNKLDQAELAERLHDFIHK